MEGFTGNEIAIVGIACRTAGANSPSELWDLLMTSRDVQREITRFNVSAYHNPDRGFKRGHTNVKQAYLMGDEQIECFDYAFFHITPNEALCVDPQQRHLLEVAYEAVENAGIPLDTFMGTDTAVFAGIDGCDYAAILGRDFDDIPRHASTGIAGCMAANRISYFFNLSGPSMVIDTACSSSMTALHQAVRTLQYGDCSMAIVCGAKMILTPDMFIPASEMGFLSSTGRCHSFDADACGYGRGEGALALLLKPLKAALADCDPIRAVLRGIRINQDGRSQGITMPSSEAQERNMRALYGLEELDPVSIQYVEAHGTGTAVGDSKEMSAINAVFDPTRSDRAAPLIVGSVKSNIGHLEAAAGLAGVIKTVLCLEYGRIPAQMHFHIRNPAIEYGQAHIPTSPMDWPSTRGRPRRAAVNCFGAGGSNGHCVLEAYTARQRPATIGDRPYLFMASASSQSTLQDMCNRYADYVAAHKLHLGDLAYTLLNRRSQLSYLHFFTACSTAEFVHNIRKLDPLPSNIVSLEADNICWIFTGQGAQWPEMGKKLLEYSDTFRQTILECERHLAALCDAPSWRLSKELDKGKNGSNVSLAELAQPLTTALQLGLVNVWRSWGLHPKMVVGHSSGEIAAAYAAGLFSLRDAIVVSYLRGRAISQLNAVPNGSRLSGAMCAVGLPEEQASRLLRKYDDKVQLAAVNSPTSCTLSGDRTAIENIVRSCQRTGVFCRDVRVNVAYHSRHVLPVADSYQKALESAGVPPLRRTSQCIMFSSVTGRLLDPNGCAAQYWTDNMTGTVRFWAALRACFQQYPELSACFEIGPHPALKGPSLETLQDGKKSIVYLASCVRGQDDFTSQLDTAGILLASGTTLDTKIINDAGNARVLTDLPPHVWDHSSRLWCESRQSRRIRFKEFPCHPLLGSRYTEDTNENPCWRSRVSANEFPWEQRKGQRMPEIAYVLMGLEAARQIQKQQDPQAVALSLRNVAFEEPLFLQNTESPSAFILHLASTKSKVSNEYNFVIFSADRADLRPDTRHCSGIFGWTDKSLSTESLLDDHHHQSHDPFLLENAQDLGLLCKSRLRDVRIGNRTATARLEQADNHVDSFALHDLLQLTQAAALAHGLSSVEKLHSICSIECSVCPKANSFLGVSTTSWRTEDTTIAALALEDCLVARGLTFETVRKERYSLPLRSLFYKAETRRDITDLPEVSSVTLTELIHLATHKWPMCDIGMLFLDHQDEQDVLAILRSFHRPRFRSVQVLASVNEDLHTSVRRVTQFADSSKLHLLLAGSISTILEHEHELHSDGVAFHKRADASNGQNWHVAKRSLNFQSHENLYDVRIFYPPEMEELTRRVATMHLPLDHNTIRNFFEICNRPYRAIILDATRNPIAVTWPGDVLVPWLQNVLKFARSLTWVTTKSIASPLVNSTTALLRTLQSEQPSIIVRHLVYDGHNVPVADEMIHAALTDLNDAFGELQYDIRDGQRRIVRWYPDDNLSRQVGVLPDSKGDMISRRKSSQLSADGTFMVIGGLGGLGRYVCSWLASHGTKHITVVSRSGPDSAQAKTLMALLENNGAAVNVLKCDACNKQALSEVLDAVRQKRNIKGVVNMAMLLGDAPLALVTAEEWDRALRLKVDSSWNLHELTLQDSLDFFILFSSIASVLGNRNQAGYNVGNAYLNSLAEYRRTQGLPAVAIALGAMTDMGVLHDMGAEDMLAALTRSGLAHLQKHHLDKIMQAAVTECADPDSNRAVILTGLNMFERVDGRLVGEQDQTMLYWTELPEFGHLQYHRRTWHACRHNEYQSLLTRITALPEAAADEVLEHEFFQFLASLLGFDVLQFNAKRKLLDYGLDSLSGVSCQYWFYRELVVSISVPQILASKNIDELLVEVRKRVFSNLK